MLTSLAIRDIVLIDRLHLAVGAGLTALTGETGAGKSILLDALGLAVGGKAEKRLVRQGASEGVAIAAFEPSREHGVWAVLEEHGIESEDGAVILRRVQRADGRARAFINDQPVSLTVLRAVGEELVEVHGQHDGHGFLRAAVHRAVLDQYAGVDSAALAAAAGALREAEEALADHREAVARAAQDAEYLRHAQGELEELNPREGEEAALSEQRAMMMAAEKATADIAEAASAVEGEGAFAPLARAARALERAGARLADAEDEARTLIESAGARIEGALAEFDEAAAAVLRARDALAIDTEALEACEARLFALRALARKHACTPDALPALRERIEGELAAVESGEARTAALVAAVKTARAAYDKAALEASGKRRAAAGELEGAVSGELAPLKLEKARFAVAIDTDEARVSPDGFDTVEFQIATNPGAPLGPLAKIASGGELARLVLALKAALAAKEGKTVVIFDEVDAGVGGAVADAVGERLARLAAEEQVLVVTHSPQVAARARTHWNVAKAGEDQALTSVTPLDPEERVEEIARMLSGAEITKEARAAAQSLLKPSEPGPKPKSKRATKSRRSAA